MTILPTVAAFTIAAARSIARRHDPLREHLAMQDGSGLPPVLPAQVRAVMRHAEKAAVRQARGGKATPNPHRPGTREHIIWATHHGATLLDAEN